MFFGILTLVTALTISAVAIWYSVAGLAAIFAAAVVPIIIMGTVLEVSKLVTAVWLHRYWHKATWWLKTYLTTAVVVLMFITSMGIFGFLSNAHVQQTAQGDSAQAEIERIDSEIARQEAVIARAEDKIETAQDQGVGGDANIQTQIDREQARIDRAYARAEPLIEEQREIIQRSEGRIIDQIDAIDRDVERVDAAIANGDIAAAQSIIGTEADGIYGPNTRAAIDSYKTRQAEQRAELEQRLSEVGNDPRVQAARAEIERVRSGVETQVAQSNKLINRLRAQLGTDTGADIDTVIDEQNERIAAANSQIDTLTEDKFELEAQYRQLEAEVGPIKYIAEFVYSEDADKDLLEEAVRWVIVIIIFVFDPLAVLLLIASQYTFRWNGRELFEGGTATAPPEPDNHPTPPAPPTVTKDLPEAVNEEFGLTAEEAAEPYVEAEPQEPAAGKKDIESWGEFENQRYEVIRQQDASQIWHQAKKDWKADHPDETLKQQKEKYLNGEIDQLPWEEYYYEPKKKILHNEEEQRTDSSRSVVSEATTYVQNQEQSASSIWKRIYDRE
jgi:peptidoglycan hydrolase-like protein with peptidoglycan-binding domain